ncbi:MAG TPA: ATP-binding protein [Candidatus Kapabacteria bacterium]|nr:ATP-binding protein [Candidatus Kapabacteria bacterium]HPO63123.1 ATP-binding protein [Candidatus Kapabacteria bacterium]
MDEYFARIEKYNFWKENKVSLGFKRNSYLSQIMMYCGNSLVKILVGQRRVGKSYLFRQIMNLLIENGVKPNNIFYINKEYTDFDFISNYLDLEKIIDLYKEKLAPVGKIYLFIDEIQNIGGWEHLINSLSQNFVEDYEIFITGSNSELLSGELATKLSGRYIKFHIFPYDFNEYCDYLNIEKSKQSFLKYMQEGGLPELFHLPNDETKSHYISSIKDTCLLRDIIQRYNIKDARLLDDLFAFLVNNAANLISINSIINFFKSKSRKTSYETLSNYIEYMKNTYLVYEAKKFNIKGKEILSGNSKYYLNDLSFKNYLYSGFQYGYGYMLENLVYLRLLRNGYKVYTGNLRNREVDFVAMKNDVVKYFQISYLLINQDTIDREYGALEAIKDNYEKYVVSLDDINLKNRNGIKHILAWQIDEVI